MIQFSGDLDLGWIRIVPEAEVEGLSKQGWKLVTLTSESQVSPTMVTRQDLNPGPPGCIGVYSTRTEMEYIPVMVTKYVMSKSKDEAMKELSEQAHRAHERVKLLEAKVADLEKSLANHPDVAKLQLQLAAYLKEIRTLQGSLEQEASNAAKLRVVLTNESEDKRAAIRALTEHVNSEYLMRLEDWISKTRRAIEREEHLKELFRDSLSECPVKGARTWAERLAADDGV